MAAAQLAFRIVQYTFRALQLVVGLAVLGLSAYVANWYNRDTLTASPPQVNLLIFVSLWSLISILYLELTPRFAPRVSNAYVALFFEATNVLFYVAGAGALGHFLARLLFCRGMVCYAARADAGAAGFLAFTWLITLGALVADVFKLGFRKNIAARKPEMTAA